MHTAVTIVALTAWSAVAAMRAPRAAALDSAALGSVTAGAGDTVVVPLTATTTDLSGLSVDITFDPALCALITGESICQAGRAAVVPQEGGTRCPAEGRVSIVLFDVSGDAVVPSGSGPIAEWVFSLLPSATSRTFPLVVNVVAARRGAAPVVLAASDGALAIEGPHPDQVVTGTPANTPTATATATATRRGPVHAVSAPTPSATTNAAPTPTCPPSMALGSAPVLTATATTDGAPNRFGGAACDWKGGGDDAPDVAYTYIPPEDGTYDITVQGTQTGLDPVVTLRTDACAPTALECAHDSTGGHQAHLSPTLTAQQPITIVVDGSGRSQGPFTLAIRQRRPDLAVTALQAAPQGTAGQTLFALATIVNQGNAPAAPFDVTLQLRGAIGDLQCGVSSMTCHFSDPEKELAPGAVVTCPQDGTTPLGVPERMPASATVTAAITTSGDDANPQNDMDQIAVPILRQFYEGFSRFGSGFDQEVFRADDGTAYQLLRAIAPLPLAADLVKVTSVAGSSDGTGGCSLTQGMSGERASAVAGVLAPLQILYPYQLVARTALLNPDDISALGFDPSFGGHLILGTDNGRMDVCANPCDCPGGGVDVFDLASADGDVPAACIANGVNAGCDLVITRNTLAFGLLASGDPPTCQDAAQVTANATICGASPADGLSLASGQGLVFIYGGGVLGGIGFQVGAAGFLISADSANRVGCAANSILGAVLRD